MANVKHAVVRTDSMNGTNLPQALVNGVFYSSEQPTAIDNAQVVVLGDKLDRENYKVTAPASTSTVDDLYLVASSELFYDQTRTHYLTEWENAAGSELRLYKLIVGNTFSATAEAFNGTPEKGKYVGFVADSTKLKVEDAAKATTFGKISFVETQGFGDGAYTYYMVDVIPAAASGV